MMRLCKPAVIACVGRALVFTYSVVLGVAITLLALAAVIAADIFLQRIFL
jgi:hypothetical protein